MFLCIVDVIFQVFTRGSEHNVTRSFPFRDYSCVWFLMISTVHLQSRCQQSSADQHAFFCGKALPVDMVLFEFFVAGVPEPRQDALHVEGIHSVGGHHTMVNLQQTSIVMNIKRLDG